MAQIKRKSKSGDSQKQLYCRICLVPSSLNNFKDLFTPFNSIQSIAQAIEEFAEIEIVKGDRHSQLICLKCFKKLNDTDDFRRLISNTDYKLKHLITIDDPLDTVKSTSNAKKLSDINDKSEEANLELVKQSADLNHEIDIKDEPEPLVIDITDDDDNDDLKIEPEYIEVRNTGLFMPENENEKYLNCNECTEVFQSSEELKVHHSNSHNETCPNNKVAAHCEKCGEIFKYKQSLNFHDCRKQYKCDICTEVFNSETDLNSHIISHSEQSAFLCEICHSYFSTESQFKKHIKAAHNRVQCQICGKLVQAISRHMKIHMRPFKCEICAQSFSTPYYLQDHLNSHTGTKAYECEICGKSFKYVRSYRHHMKAHREGKRFICEVCLQRFSYKTNLKYHMQRKHNLILS